MLIPTETLQGLSSSLVRRPSNGLSELYDVVFVLNINSRGWILEKICKVIARQLGQRTKIIFTERNNTVSGWLPLARSYFFSHYKIYVGALKSGILPEDAKTYVWFTHPSFSAGNTVEAFVAALNQCTKVFTANSFHANALAFLGIEPKRLTTILGGADPELFKPSDRKGSTVGIVGAYYERKNPDLLLDVVRAMSDVTFLLIAPHPSEVENKSLLWENWKRFPELRGLPNLRYVSARFEEFGQHYADMDVYLSLSSLEGGPIPLIEAMFSNCYPVVTKTGFAEDVVQDGTNGLLLPLSPSIQQVEDAIRAALGDVTTDVAATVADYSWDAFGLNFREVISPSIRAGRSISFGSRDAQLDYLRDGWGEADSSGVWLAMKTGTARFRVAPDTQGLAISFLAQAAVGLEGVPLRIRLNNRVVEEAIFEAGPHVREISLSEDEAAGPLTVGLELTASRFENLGTICLEAIAAMTRPAVSDGPDAAGLINSKWELEGAFEGTPHFEVPVVILGAPERQQSRQLRRTLNTTLGIPTLPNDGQFEPGWDGIAIADGVSAAALSALRRVDGIVARTFEEKVTLLDASPGIPAIVVPEVVGASLTGRTSAMDTSIRTAVIFESAEPAGRTSPSWLLDILSSRGIEHRLSDAAAMAPTGSASDTRGAVTAIAEGADLCLFSGAERDLPLISSCLGMGIPVLIYGPSELYPALSASGLKHVFIQNASRLAKTLNMLAEARARRATVQQLQQVLADIYGLHAATQRYAGFARGLVDVRKLRRLRPNIAIVSGASFTGENPASVAGAVSFALDAGCRVSILYASPDAEAPVSHPDVAVAFMGHEPGAKCPFASASAGKLLSNFTEQHRPDLFVCLSEAAFDFVRTADERGTKVICADIGEARGMPAQGGDHSAIKVPRLMPARLSASAIAAFIKGKAGARKQLGFKADDVIVYSSPEGSVGPSRDIRLLDALEVAREVGSRVRFVVEANEADASGGILDRLRRRATKSQDAEIFHVEREQGDIAMRSADLVLINDPTTDPTVLSRALAFGLPILARSDVSGADLLGPRVSGLAYEPHDREAFRGLLKSLLADLPLRQEFSSQARATFAGLPSYDDAMLDYASGIVSALEA